jgi:hypothetical protein
MRDVDEGQFLQRRESTILIYLRSGSRRYLSVGVLRVERSYHARHISGDQERQQLAEQSVGIGL